MVTFCWTPVSLFFDYAMSPSSRLRFPIPAHVPVQLFDDLTQDELDAIAKKINDTPMKQLGYKTPNEVWDEEITRLQSQNTNPSTSVALTS